MSRVRCRGQHIGHRRLGDQPTLGDHHDVVGETAPARPARDSRRAPTAGRGVRATGAQPVDARRVEPVRRLVEDREMRVAEYAPASPSRCRIPSDSWPIRLPAAASSPTWASTARLERRRPRSTPPGSPGGWRARRPGCIPDRVDQGAERQRAGEPGSRTPKTEACRRSGSPDRPAFAVSSSCPRRSGRESR